MSSNPTTDELAVTVSGGSMGGLFAGIALHHAGHDVHVFERSTGNLRGRGGGIVAQPAVNRVLDRHCAVDPDGLTTTTSERRYLDADGGVDRSRAESMAFTSWDAVYRALRDTFPDDRYHMGREVVDVSPPTGATTFADGTETTADLVVAAEGGRSRTREQLLPDVTPEFPDYVAWRGVVPEADLPAAVVEAVDDRFIFYEGPGLFALAYLIPGADGTTASGDRRFNWVWYDTLDNRDRDRIFTDANGKRRRFGVPPGNLDGAVERRLHDRATAVLPPALEQSVTATTDPFVQAIYDLRVPAMVVDRTCLLGDAAFVARPHTAAGTAKAAADATALATAVDRSSSLSAALSSWGETRSDDGARLVARGARMGDERLGLG
ncbi:MAG: FAD-dependent monooxygenase [Haloplanus sp.]